MSKGNTKTKKELIESLPDSCFWVNNGPILSDLKELYSALRGEITVEQFSHHVTSDRNDFADWIEIVLNDKRCADMVRKVKKQDTVADKVKLCLKDYRIK